MKRLLKFLALVISCSLILTGCWDQKVFEQVGFILSFGIEESKDDKIIITSAYPVIGGVEPGKVDVISTKTTIVRGGRTNLRLAAPKLIEGGKVQQILLSDSIAKKGIHDLMEVFQRDATVPAICYVVIVEGSPEELLKKATEFKTKPRVSFYIFQLLDNNEKLSNIPNTKIFDFDINFYAPGLDPIVPTIKLGNDVIIVTGCALFSDDKMTGQLGVFETNMLLGMMKQLKFTDFIIGEPEFSDKTDEKIGVAITLFDNKREINIDFSEEGTPIVEIDVKYTCNMDEYKWDKTMDPKVQKDMEQKISKHLTAMSNNVVKKLQEANCDPIGIGDMIRAKYSEYWKSIDWKEMYKKADISVKVHAEIKNVGIIK
jgi:Ger(x)C family germination protein